MHELNYNLIQEVDILIETLRAADRIRFRAKIKEYKNAARLSKGLEKKRAESWMRTAQNIEEELVYMIERYNTKCQGI